MAYTPTKLNRWTRPQCYIGPSYPEFFLSGFGRSRDSDHIEESNFQVAKAQLQDLPEPADWPHDDAPIQVVRDSHWAVGWIEYILIHQDFDAGLKLADELKASVEDYPILDESDLGEREHEAACEFWDHMPLRERVSLCVKNGVSPFAARHDRIPDDDGVWEYLRGY